MSPKALKIALAASVALNLFAVAAGVTVIVGQARIESRVESQHRGTRVPFRTMLESMDPSVRDRVRQELRATAMASRPDFNEARTARRAAIAAAEAERFDADEVSTLLEQSRTAELRGRSRLEAGAVTVLGTLDIDDRRALSSILARNGGRSGRHGGDRGDRREPPAAPVAP
ncbi:periplasmic heavy metal sensor [uncultured Brevundimonas sp.]|uniref:periplasmic heavy metal sensor n=1 Tax=uncultured Brevundimonas sp. TaxID=213418 RepID=UPI0030EE2FBF